MREYLPLHMSGSSMQSPMVSADGVTAVVFDPATSRVESVVREVVRVQDAAFGYPVLSKENLLVDFRDSSTTAVLLQTSSEDMIGFAVAEYANRSTAHVVLTAIEKAYRGRKLLGVLLATLDCRLVERGYKEVTRDARTKYGYAGKLKRFYGDRVVSSSDWYSKIDDETLCNLRIRLQA